MENTSSSNLISLKEAASISGYSADYIGQLIRAGKISGKQVYCNVQWMTTAEAVMSYKNKGKDEKDGEMANKWRQVKMELGIIKLFFQTFKYALPIMLVIVVCFILLASFIFASFGSNRNNISDKNVGGSEALSF